MPYDPNAFLGGMTVGPYGYFPGTEFARGSDANGSYGYFWADENPAPGAAAAAAPVAEAAAPAAPASPPPAAPSDPAPPPAPAVPWGPTTPPPSDPSPLPYQAPSEPFTSPRTDPLSSDMGWPTSPPPSQQQLNDVWYGKNSSNGNFPAAQMPTFATNPSPMPMQLNNIPVGNIPGRTAEGLLSSRNAPNYIQGLLGKYNPGNWQGGLADKLSKSVPQSTPFLDQRRDGNSAAPAPTAAAAIPAASPAPTTTGPDGVAWNLTNGGVITGYRRDYSPVFGPPGSTPSQAFV